MTLARFDVLDRFRRAADELHAATAAELEYASWRDLESLDAAIAAGDGAAERVVRARIARRAELGIRGGPVSDDVNARRPLGGRGWGDCFYGPHGDCGSPWPFCSSCIVDVLFDVEAVDAESTLRRAQDLHAVRSGEWVRGNARRANERNGAVLAVFEFLARAGRALGFGPVEQGAGLAGTPASLPAGPDPVVRTSPPDLVVVEGGRRERDEPRDDDNSARVWRSKRSPEAESSTHGLLDRTF